MILQLNDVQIKTILLQFDDPNIIESICFTNKRLYNIYKTYLTDHVYKSYIKIYIPINQPLKIDIDILKNLPYKNYPIIDLIDF